MGTCSGGKYSYQWFSLGSRVVLSGKQSGQIRGGADISFFIFYLKTFQMKTFHTLEEKHKRMLCVEFYTS